MTDNPYVAPKTSSIAKPRSSESEEMRRMYIKHEASVKSVGFLYGLIGVFLMLPAVLGLVFSNGGGKLQDMGMFLLYLIPALLLLWAGYGVRKLKSWSRIPAGIISGIGLLGFPIGTLLNGYILYLICGKKGSVVFSDAYAEVIRETPHVKNKTSKAMWIVLLVLLLLIAGFISYAAMQ